MNFLSWVRISYWISLFETHLEVWMISSFAIYVQHVISTKFLKIGKTYHVTRLHLVWPVFSILFWYLSNKRVSFVFKFTWAENYFSSPHRIAEKSSILRIIRFPPGGSCARIWEVSSHKRFILVFSHRSVLFLSYFTLIAPSFSRLLSVPLVHLPHPAPA